MFVYTISSTSESKVFQIPKINTNSKNQYKGTQKDKLGKYIGLDRYYNIVKISF